MIVIDMSNLVFSAVLDFHAKTKEQVDMHVIRNLCIDRLKTYKEKLKEFGPEIVLAFDSRHYWRKDIFPFYKGKRKEGRDKSTFDWNAFFPMYDQFKQELREYFPVKCLEVEGAEADDLMGVLGPRYAAHGSVVLVTSDGDMLQLQHQNAGIKQWSPWHKKFLTPRNTEYDLFEHICQGDGGDGIPNILSDDDTFMSDPKKRQKSLRKTKLEEWKKHGINNPEYFCPDAEALDRFHRNRKLIDLRCIPDALTVKIVEAYEEAKPVTGKMFNYLTANRLMKILKDGGF